MNPSATYPSPTINTTSLAERVKSVRTAWGWSQLAMAEILRVDQASVSFWERGKVKPSGAALVAISALFRCTVEALETGYGFQIPEPPSNGHNPARGISHRSVCLPRVNRAGITLVDLASGAAQRKRASEASLELSLANKQGRRIWVVVE